MTRGRHAILSIGSTRNVGNPKACNVKPLVLTKQTEETKDINRVLREAKRRCAWRKVRNKCTRIKSKYAQKIEPQTVNMRNRDLKSAVKGKLEEKIRKINEEKKVELQGKEPVPTERVVKRESRAYRREQTEKPNQNREVIKKHRRAEKKEPKSPSARTEEIGESGKIRDKKGDYRSTRIQLSRNPNADRAKRTGERANTYSVDKASRIRAKRPLGKILGMHKPNSFRYESTLLSSKGAYYESPYCNKNQTK